MMTVSNPVVQATSPIRVTWLLILLVCVSSALGNSDVDIIPVMALEHQSFGFIPNVQRMVDLASSSTGAAEGTLYSADFPCLTIVTLGRFEDTFKIKNETNFCSAFFKTKSGFKLTFEVSGFNLYSCNEEYLYLNDGATLESTLCDGGFSVMSRGSRFLYVQYKRQTKTGTAFNFTVKAVPDVVTMPEITMMNLMVEKSFNDSQLCKNCGYINRRTRQPRVIGGSPAPVTENPWMVGVHITRKGTNERVSSVGSCGATILDRRHVLTAGHCVKTESTHDFPRVIELFVVAGSDLGFDAQKTQKNVQKIKVSHWYTHPSYNPDFEHGKSYDIAVLRLDEELNFNDRVGPVCLAAPLDFIGSDVTVTGYGYTREEGKSASQLQAVKLNIRSGGLCDSIFKKATPEFVFQSHQVCLYSPSMDACLGDSGGPAVLKWQNRTYQVGVVSFGHDCRDPNIRMRHGGYTRVSSFTPWIKSVFQGNSSC